MEHQLHQLRMVNIDPGYPSPPEFLQRANSNSHGKYCHTKNETIHTQTQIPTGSTKEHGKT